MAAFSTMVEFLENVGFFTYLAFFLLLILLYYLFEHLLGKHIKRLGDGNFKKVLAVIFAVVITVLLFFVSAPLGDAATVISVIIFVLAAFFILLVLLANFAGVDVLSFFQK
jgi:hypothetical protein